MVILGAWLVFRIVYSKFGDLGWGHDNSTSRAISLCAADKDQCYQIHEAEMLPHGVWLIILRLLWVGLDMLYYTEHVHGLVEWQVWIVLHDNDKEQPEVAEVLITYVSFGTVRSWVTALKRAHRGNRNDRDPFGRNRCVTPLGVSAVCCIVPLKTTVSCVPHGYPHSEQPSLPLIETPLTGIVVLGPLWVSVLYCSSLVCSRLRMRIIGEGVGCKKHVFSNSNGLGEGPYKVLPGPCQASYQARLYTQLGNANNAWRSKLGWNNMLSHILCWASSFI